MIKKINEKIELSNTKMVDLFVLLFYTGLHFLIFTRHELFYDEAIAWNIARRASITDIVFFIPHYEGHPPLWHLVLAVFAKAGAPYELSLAIVSYIFTAAAIIVLFKSSNFPKLVKWLLPFTYFFFFQYGVVTRPYCMMILAFFVCGAFYGKRNEKTGRYILSLAFLCLTTAYGIVIAGGIAICWLLEIFMEKGKKIKQCLLDKRVLWLMALLLFALFLMYLIIPIEKVNAESNVGDLGANLVKRLFVMFFVVPSDLFFTNVINDYMEMASFVVDSMQLRMAVMLSLMIWCGVFYYGRKRHTLLLGILPYALFSTFSALVYFKLHHLGIGFFVFFFWMWCTYETKDSQQDFSKQYGYVRNVMIASVVATMTISVIWSIGAVKLEWKNYVSLGKNQAQFIKEYGLENYRVMTGWKISENGVNSREHLIAECVLPYLDNNIFYNYNDGTNEKGYLLNRKPTEVEMKTDFEAWASAGEPDILFQVSTQEWGMVFIEDDYSKYKPVFVGSCDRIWKNTLIPFYRTFIRVREDLIQELNFTQDCVMVRN